MYYICPYQVLYPNNYYPLYRHNNNSKRAFAEIKGGPLAPNLHGYVIFTETESGVDIFVEVNGLPPFQRGEDNRLIGPHGFHIHEKASCVVGEATNPFQAAGGHWNPTNEPHGNHSGDLPVLFSNNGYNRMNVFTNKFHVQDVIGKTIIIHEGPDDFRTEPAGDSGKRLACGFIRPFD